VVPVAVYEATWLPTISFPNDNDDIDDDSINIINISLVEQSLGKSNYHHIYWLRVGLLVKTKNYRSNDNNSNNNNISNITGDDSSIQSNSGMIVYNHSSDESYNSNINDQKKETISTAYKEVDINNNSNDDKVDNNNDDNNNNDDKVDNRDDTQLYVLGMIHHHHHDIISASQL